MLMYRVDHDKTSPVPVECPDPKWPHYDNDGRQIFENTHFATLEDAWETLQAEADAGVSLSCGAVEHQRSELARMEKLLVDKTLHANRVREARKEAERGPS